MQQPMVASDPRFIKSDRRRRGEHAKVGAREGESGPIEDEPMLPQV